MTAHNCDLCGGTHHFPILAAKPYVGDQLVPVVCADCGFVFVISRRTPAEIAASWDKIWGEGYTSAWPMVKARLTYVAELMKERIPNHNNALLDIGAGEGDFLKIIDGKHFMPTGLEPSEANVKKINEMRFPCWHGTIESFEPCRTYDVVTLLWTLENTGDCMGVLRKARQLLKPDGHIVVATGSRILVPYKKPLSTYFSKNPQDLHCFRFSANTLRLALGCAGFGDAKLNRYEDSDWLVAIAQPGIPGYAIQRDNPQEVIGFFDNWLKAFP